jgi:hypothetical protein
VNAEEIETGTALRDGTTRVFFDHHAVEQKADSDWRGGRGGKLHL